MSITTMTFAARDFSARRGASDEHTLSRHVGIRSDQRSLAEKELPPEGLRRIWPVAALLVGHRSTSGLLPPRALPQAKCGATNVIVVMFSVCCAMLTQVRRRSLESRLQIFQQPRHV